MKISQQLLAYLLTQSEPTSIDTIAAGTGLARRIVGSNVNSLVKGKRGLVGRKGKGAEATFFIKDRAAAEERIKARAGSASTRRAKKPRKSKARKKTRRGKKTTKRPAAVAVPEFTFFLSDELEVQIVRADGEECSAILPIPDSIRLRDFLNRVSPLLEAA